MDDGSGTAWSQFAAIHISDCDRKVTISFELAEESHANNLYKVDTMINSLKAFRRALVKAQKRQPKE